MVADRDIYADKDGNITDDPEQYARQIAVKGFNLDERIARRYGITDVLVSTTELRGVRRVTGRSAPSVRVTKAAETEAKAEASKPKAADQPQPKPQEPAEAAEPTTVVEAKPEAEKPTAKKEK